MKQVTLQQDTVINGMLRVKGEVVRVADDFGTLPDETTNAQVDIAKRAAENEARLEQARTERKRAADEFAKLVSLTIKPTEGGTLAFEPAPAQETKDGLLWFERDSKVSITARANRGFEFVRWEGDVDEKMQGENPLTLVMDAEKTLAAVWEKRKAGKTR